MFSTLVWLQSLSNSLRANISQDAPRARRRRHVPELAPLEARAMQTVNGGLSVVHVHPGLLPSYSDGRQVNVHAYGTIYTNHSIPPKGFYFVTDQYRADEPSGQISLKSIGTYKGWYGNSFSFNISLQAKRSSATQNGRFYDLFVGATDSDGSDGRTVEILVPKNSPPPPTKPTSALHVRHTRRG